MNNNFINLMEAYAAQKGFVRFQIDSYNDFITRRIPKVLSEIGHAMYSNVLFIITVCSIIVLLSMEILDKFALCTRARCHG